MEGVIELANHHFAANIVNTGSDKHHKGMLNQERDKLDKEQGICMDFNVCPTDCYYLQGRKSNNYTTAKSDNTLKGLSKLTPMRGGWTQNLEKDVASSIQYFA